MNIWDLFFDEQIESDFDSFCESRRIQEIISSQEMEDFHREMNYWYDSQFGE